ncbi:MAG: hypothetical protein AAF385_02625 [Pseudomonadota bacterium]
MAVIAVPLLALADELLPDEDFLEYLGSWEESDEDWLTVLDELEADKANTEAKADEPKPPIDDETDEPEEKESGEDYDA